MAGARLNNHPPEWSNVQTTIYLFAFALMGTDGEGQSGYVRYFREEPFEASQSAIGLITNDFFGPHLRESYRNQWTLDEWEREIPVWLKPKEVVICRRRKGKTVEIPATTLKVMGHLYRLHQELAMRARLNDGNAPLFECMFHRLGTFIRDQEKSWERVVGE